VFLFKLFCSLPETFGGLKSWSFGSSKHIRFAVPKAVAGFHHTDLAAAFLFLLSGFDRCFRHQVLLSRQRYSPGSYTDGRDRVEERE
jgi:hypothetical protein